MAAARDPEQQLLSHSLRCCRAPGTQCGGRSTGAVNIQALHTPCNLLWLTGGRVHTSAYTPLAIIIVWDACGVAIYKNLYFQIMYSLLLSHPIAMHVPRMLSQQSLNHCLAVANQKKRSPSHSSSLSCLPRENFASLLRNASSSSTSLDPSYLSGMLSLPAGTRNMVGKPR